MRIIFLLRINLLIIENDLKKKKKALMGRDTLRDKSCPVESVISYGN